MTASPQALLDAAATDDPGDEAICDWTDSDDQAQGPDQRDLRRHRGLLLQRLPPCRLRRHPDQLRLLPADPAGDAARQRRQCQAPGAVGRRQHRDAPAHPERRPAGAGGCGAGPGAGDGGSVRLQLPVRRLPPRVRRLLHELPHRGERLGRHRSTTMATACSVRTTATAATRRSRSWRRNTRSSSRTTRCAPTRAGLATVAAAWPAPASSASPRRRSPSTPCSTGPRRRRAASSAVAPAPAAASSSSGRATTEFRRFSEVFGTVSDSKFTRVIVTEGDEIMLNSAGGGGYGEPARARPRTHRGRPAPGVRLAGGGGARLPIPGR